ncbi:MAG TPA: hypothetical protein VFV93_09000, partial [Thermomicrobiales bacterium]|nr:hypothetical protein [Thermomicrobiales bacterium]
YRNIALRDARDAREGRYCDIARTGLGIVRRSSECLECSIKSGIVVGRQRRWNACIPQRC